MASLSRALEKLDIGWDGLGPRLWFLASSPMSGQALPATIALPLLRPEDAILLPGEHASTKEFLDFCGEILPIKVATQVGFLF